MTLMQAASRRSMLAAASSCLPLAAVLLLGGCGKSEQAQTQRVAAAPTEVAAVQTPPPDYPIELACAGLGGKAVLIVADARAMRSAVDAVGWKQERQVQVRMLGQRAFIAAYRKPLAA
jgi:hypothetical protein